MIKSLIIILFVLIVYSLGSAAYFMVRHKGHDKRMAKALSWRIGLSISLILFLVIGYKLGIVVPHQL